MITKSRMIFSLPQAGKTIIANISGFTGIAWRTALKYTIPNILFSVVYNLPKFFEFEMQEYRELNFETRNMTMQELVDLNFDINMTKIKANISPTKLRLDENYVYFYVNLSRFLVSVLIPLVMLAILNFFICR